MEKKDCYTCRRGRACAEHPPHDPSNFDTAMMVFAFMTREERVKVLTAFAGEFACGDPDYNMLEEFFEDAVLKVANG